MAKILVIGGTAEGKKFVEEMTGDHQVTLSVYSQMGADLVTAPGIEKRVGPLDQEEMTAFLREGHYDFLVDLSHPYAAAVSANAAAACEEAVVPYLRYLRPSYRPQYENTMIFPDYEGVFQYLDQREGNILFTIGSKNIHRFLSLRDFTKRCYFRILASSHILREVEELGVTPGQIFAMKGVASTKLNLALLHMVQADFLVTKDSGLEGGLMEKEAAAKEMGICLIIVGRPADAGSSSFTEIWERIGADHGK